MMAEGLDNEVLFEELAREVIDGEMLLCEGQLAFAFLDELTEDVDGQALAFEEVVRRTEEARGELENKYYRRLVDGLNEDASKDDAYDWYPRYEYLVSLGWHWRVAVFIAWSTMPKKYRIPSTQEELATRYLGLNSDRVIATWRKKYPQIERVIREFAADPLLAHLGEVMSALAASAADPSYRNHRDRQIYLEMVGKYRQEQTVTLESDIKDAADLTRLDEREHRRKASVARDMVKGANRDKGDGGDKGSG